MKKIPTLLLFFFLISCSQNKPVIEVIYTINEFNTEDNRINVTLDITNKTSKDISSLWSLHWNQQSAILNDESIPDNLKYEYVGGQSYNILSFGKDYTLNTGESISIDLKQSGVVKRKSDLPVGGFIVLNNETIDVKFINIWKDADGIENLNPPSAQDRYDYYSTINLIDKLQIDVEGAEFQILNSINFEKIEIKKIIFEFKHFDGTFKEGPKLKSIKEKLISFNYKLKEIDKENILAEKN